MSDSIFTPLVFALSGSTTAITASRLAGDSFAVNILSNALTYSGLVLALAALFVTVRAGAWKAFCVNVTPPPAANDHHLPDRIKAVAFIVKTHRSAILGDTNKKAFYVVMAWGLILALWSLAAAYLPEAIRANAIVIPALLLPGLVAIAWVWALNWRTAFDSARHEDIDSLQAIKMAANDLGVSLAVPTAETELRRPGGHAAVIWETRALSGAVIQAAVRARDQGSPA